MQSRFFRSGRNFFLVSGTAALLAAGTPNVALAHTETGTLGIDASATDLYLITCDDNGNGVPAYLLTQVVSSAKTGPLIGVLTSKGSQAVNSTDPANGDANYSPAVKVEGGRGDYLLAVSKTKKGKGVYVLQYHCLTATDVHTGTEIVTLQNQ